MELSCSAKCLKYFVFVSNAIICMIGCFFLILSIRALAKTDIVDDLPELADSSDVHSGVIRAGLIMLAIFSCFIFLVGFMGCFGAVTENPTLLLVYSIVLFTFIVLVITSQFLAIAGRKTFEESLEVVYYNLFFLTFFTKFNVFKIIVLCADYRYNSSEARQNFTSFEEAFNCCGATAQLKPIFIEEHLCEGELAQQPDCCSVLTVGVSAAYLILTFVLLFATVIGLSAACILRSSLTHRLSYAQF
ncbi:unnamed protein product [Anisakis simplex]|uniref:Tetraspanin n=1 Tax=Anisakis simplex TaxID=6269 RepID=A0A0M3JTA1_ANISI|nr:unnamed protein product [Anisakis simplex]